MLTPSNLYQLHPVKYAFLDGWLKLEQYGQILPLFPNYFWFYKVYSVTSQSHVWVKVFLSWFFIPPSNILWNIPSSSSPPG